MTKILFVDDDAIIRRGISGKIDWNKYGWKLVHTARDTMEALDYIKNNQPDIILTDIKMPGMSGIEMAQITKDYYPGIKFVFLSGYKDFEYAQQVLKLNAVDYLTKPLNDGKLIEALKKAESIQKKESSENYILNRTYPVIKRNYISHLLKENFQQMDESFFTAFDINLSRGLGVVGFIELHYVDSMSYDQLRKKIETYCTGLTQTYRGSFFFCMDNLQIFMIYTDNDAKEESAFYARLQQVEAKINAFSCRHLGGKDASFFYGSTMRNLNDLYYSYQAALQNINFRVDDLLLEIRRYIEQHYDDCDLSLITIAEHFNMNHCYLTSVFKKKFHVNLYDCVIKVRMENAARLIQSTRLKNYEIAAATGYKNPQYFSNSFKKFYGCTATQYRERCRKEG